MDLRPSRSTFYSGTNWLTSPLQGALMLLPWLAPWSPTPLPNTVPLLISWACIGCLMLLGQPIRPLDIARAWAWAALISSVMGLIQYFGAATAFSPWLHVPGLGEANANLRQRNQLATLSGIGILSVLWWRANGLKTPHALWMLALLAIGNAATASRTGLLHMLLIACLAIVWSSRVRIKAQRLSPLLALWAFAIYLLGNWALPGLLNGLYSQGQVMAGALARMGVNDGCGSRRVLWGNVLELIGEKPWTGWGWGELKYAHYITSYEGGADTRFCDILGNAHNLPLHLAVTLGVPVVAVLGIALLAVLVRTRPWQCRLPNQQLAWSVLAVIGLHSLLEFPLWYGPFQMAVLLCGVLFMAPPSGDITRASLRARLAGGMLLATVCLVGADYARVKQIYLPAQQRWHVWSQDPLTTARSSWLFGRSATFAELTMTPVTPQNAPWILATSMDMLHFSPEPMVVRQLIKSALILDRQDLVQLHRARWQSAFPSEPMVTP